MFHRTCPDTRMAEFSPAFSGTIGFKKAHYRTDDYSGTLIIEPLLGWAKGGQISQVVSLSRWFKHGKTKTGRLKGGLFLKVVRLPRWSHSKVPLHIIGLNHPYLSRLVGWLITGGQYMCSQGFTITRVTGCTVKILYSASISLTPITVQCQSWKKARHVMLKPH